MLYMIDSANLDEIRRCIELFPVSGVTTNPTIIANANTDFPLLIKNIRGLIGNDRMLHIQTTQTLAKEIIAEATALNEFVGGDFYIKIPVSAEGLKATIELKKRGLKVTETAIFTQQQALLSARAGADFVAPYINRLDSIVSDGAQVVSEIVKMFNIFHLNCRILAASFKTVEQIQKVAMAGGHSVTLNPNLFDALVSHPMTKNAMDAFAEDWKSVYGDAGIVDLLRK